MPNSIARQVKTTQVPVASGRGESGRESVGDGVPTAKLLLLLLRELRRRGKQNSKEKTFAYAIQLETQPLTTCVFYQHNKHPRKINAVNLGTLAVDRVEENNDNCNRTDNGVYAQTYAHGYKHACMHI